MLTYSLEQRNGENLYEYFYRCIRGDIESGLLKKDEKLPSKRQFAENNGISVITVETTYGQLVAEGYVYSLPKKGFFVADIHQKKPRVEKPEIVIKTEEKKTARYDLTSQMVDAEQFPFSTWTRLMRRRIADDQEHMLEPSPANGIYELRRAIAKQLRDLRDMQVTPEQVIIGAGTEYLYSLLASLLGRDRLIALENPGYSKPRRIYTSLDMEVALVSMDEAGVEVQGLRDSHADMVQVSPSHHFPTGIVMPVQRRYELLAWANEREGRYILEDDYDSELRLAGKPIPALFSMDFSGKVIYLNTFTKSLTPTIRISYMVLPEELLVRYREKLGFYSCTVSNFEQYTLATFIEEGYFEKHINRMRVHYRETRDALIAAIERMLPPDSFSIREKDGGLHFILHVETALSDRKLKERLAARDVKISLLSDYGSETSADIIVSYSSIKKEEVEDVIKILCNSLQYRVDKEGHMCIMKTTHE